MFILNAEKTMNDTSTTSNFSTPLLFLLGAFFSLFIGPILIVNGGSLIYIAHGREIRAYATQQAMSVVKETVDEVTPVVATVAGSIAKEISKGIKEGQEEDK